MRLPPLGLCLPCHVKRVIDGDTLEVVLPPPTMHVRLLDCWAPEHDTPEGEAATEAAEQFIGAADAMRIWIPRPEEASLLSASVWSFGRVLGHVFLRSDTTLSELMVRHGHATKVRQSKE